MSDFAPWLRNLAIEDAELGRLHEFVDNHSREWPYYSNKLSDFFRIVVLARDKNEVQLLDTLERYYMVWKNSIRTDSGNTFWSNFGPLALFLIGMIVTLFLMYQIYAPSLAAALSERSHTNGLITFLLAFAATSTIVALAIGILWLDRSDISSGFAKTKDISTVLAGVIGTIMVFYFVSPAATPAGRDAGVLAGPASARAPAAVSSIRPRAANTSATASSGNPLPLEPAATAIPVLAPSVVDAPPPPAPPNVSAQRTASGDGAGSGDRSVTTMPVPPVPVASMSGASMSGAPMSGRHRGRP